MDKFKAAIVKKFKKSNIMDKLKADLEAIVKKNDSTDITQEKIANILLAKKEIVSRMTPEQLESISDIEGIKDKDFDYKEFIKGRVNNIQEEDKQLNDLVERLNLILESASDKKEDKKEEDIKTLFREKKDLLLQISNEEFRNLRVTKSLYKDLIEKQLNAIKQERIKQDIKEAIKSIFTEGKQSDEDKDTIKAKLEAKLEEKKPYLIEMSEADWSSIKDIEGIESADKNLIEEPLNAIKQDKFNKFKEAIKSIYTEGKKNAEDRDKIKAQLEAKLEEKKPYLIEMSEADWSSIKDIEGIESADKNLIEEPLNAIKQEKKQQAILDFQDKLEAIVRSGKSKEEIQSYIKATLEKNKEALVQISEDDLENLIPKLVDAIPGIKSVHDKESIAKQVGEILQESRFKLENPEDIPKKEQKPIEQKPIEQENKEQPETELNKDTEKTEESKNEQKPKKEKRILFNLLGDTDVQAKYYTNRNERYKLHEEFMEKMKRLEEMQKAFEAGEDSINTEMGLLEKLAKKKSDNIAEKLFLVCRLSDDRQTLQSKEARLSEMSDYILRQMDLLINFQSELLTKSDKVNVNEAKLLRSLGDTLKTQKSKLKDQLEKLQSSGNILPDDNIINTINNSQKEVNVLLEQVQLAFKQQDNDLYEHSKNDLGFVYAITQSIKLFFNSFRKIYQTKVLLKAQQDATYIDIKQLEQVGVDHVRQARDLYKNHLTENFLKEEQKIIPTSLDDKEFLLDHYKTLSDQTDNEKAKKLELELELDMKIVKAKDLNDLKNLLKESPDLENLFNDRVNNYLESEAESNIVFKQLKNMPLTKARKAGGFIFTGNIEPINIVRALRKQTNISKSKGLIKLAGESYKNIYKKDLDQLFQKTLCNLVKKEVSLRQDIDSDQVQEGGGDLDKFNQYSNEALLDLSEKRARFSGDDKKNEYFTNLKEQKNDLFTLFKCMVELEILKNPNQYDLKHQRLKMFNENDLFNAENYNDERIKLIEKKEELLSKFDPNIEEKLGKMVKDSLDCAKQQTFLGLKVPTFRKRQDTKQKPELQ